MLLAKLLSTEEKIHLQRVVNKNYTTIIITDHFLKRWNERIKKPKFEHKKDLATYLENMTYRRKIHRIKNNHHIIDDDIIIVAEKSKKNRNEIILVTTYGSTINNPILYNMCMSGDIYKNFKKYGKLNLNCAS